MRSDLNARMAQQQLFQTSPLPAGFVYRQDFISPDAEVLLLEEIARLPLQESRYREWTAKRRIVSFGGQYDFSHSRMNPSAPIPPFLHPLRNQLGQWAAIDPALFTQANVTEYRAGTQLGWHRDLPDFEIVAGVSLQGVARMRFRPYPPAVNARAACAIDLQPRSAYLIRDIARWKWQHAISPTKELRYSLTFRTLRKSAKAEEVSHRAD
jgi:alkylated DNA repair dioxygenase AlkB